MIMKVSFTGNGHTGDSTVYVARSGNTNDAQIWVVNPDLFSPKMIFDAIAYRFSGEGEKEGVLEQVNLRVRKESEDGLGLKYAIRPAMLNYDGNFYLYSSGLDAVNQWSVFDLDSEKGIVYSGKMVILQAYITLNQVMQQNPGLKGLAAEVLRKADNIDLDSLLLSTRFTLTEKPGEEFPKELYY